MALEELRTLDSPRLGCCHCSPQGWVFLGRLFLGKSRLHFGVCELSWHTQCGEDEGVAGGRAASLCASDTLDPGGGICDSEIPFLTCQSLRSLDTTRTRKHLGACRSPPGTRLCSCSRRSTSPGTRGDAQAEPGEQRQLAPSRPQRGHLPARGPAPAPGAQGQVNTRSSQGSATEGQSPGRQEPRHHPANKPSLGPTSSSCWVSGRESPGRGHHKHV